MSLDLIYTYNIYRKKRRRGGKGWKSWKMLADRAVSALNDRRIINATPVSNASVPAEIRRPLE